MPPSALSNPLTPTATPYSRKHSPASLDVSKLSITKTLNPLDIPPPEELEFGRYGTDHMLQIKWTASQGWYWPEIIPYRSINLDPAACVFHYAFECFEGMKAYKDAEGRVRLFRPEMNLERLNKSSTRIALPSFDSEELLKLLAEFVTLEKRFIPTLRGYSLYLRPVIIGTSRSLGVVPPTSALLYVIASPVGSYYNRGFKAISLEATSNTTAARAWPGGVGNRKVGANYAPCMVPELNARSRGYEQILWLFGEEDYVTEAGTMNLFVVLRSGSDDGRELVTAPLDGTILPGVTRDCVLSLARERLQFHGWRISERNITMGELDRASMSGDLVEVFGTGTAAIVSPIRKIRWNGRDIDCGLAPKEEAGGVAMQMKAWIEARQYGEEEHEWSVLVDDVLR